MATLAGLVGSVAVVLALWLGLSGPDTSPVDDPSNAQNGSAQTDGGQDNGGGGP